VAIIGHLTHNLNIPRRKADNIMSGNLRFSPLVLHGWSPDVVEKIRNEATRLFRDKLDVSVSATG
jgi:hypothetical protein